MIEFSELKKVAEEEGGKRAEYSSRCNRLFSAVAEELQKRAVRSGMRADVLPENNREPMNGRISARAEIKFGGEPSFYTPSGVSTWFGVRALGNEGAFELAGPSFVGVFEDVESAVDTIIEQLIGTLRAETSKLAGE